ncbi:MAG: M6 family metalloprotease domain-containing protein, partial [Cyclobacteriaceae bacterium]
MKALFFASLLFISFSVLLHAQPQACYYLTAPYPVPITEPDGSQVMVVGQGTSAHHRQETADGYTVVRNKAGFLEYAIKVNGKLAPSGIRANTTSPTNAASPARLSIPKHLQEDILHPFANASSSAQQASDLAQGVLPSRGNINVLVILVEFEDFSRQYSRAEYEKVFRGPMEDPDKVSFKEFYQKASYGQLNFNVDFTRWYPAKGSVYDYGYRNNGYESARELAADVIQQADADVDFTKYDNDQDGVVDGVIILQAGRGAEEGSQTQYIWSHQWSVPDQIVDGKILNRYCMVPGLRNSGIVDIGIIAHEVGHLLGQPDLYDTSGQTVGLGNWDIMSFGSWAGRGHYPADFSAWTKDRWEWINVQNITGEFGKHALSPSGEAPDNYYRINTPVDQEYFLLEYRDNRTWEQGIPGAGLAIWHINEFGSQYVGIPKEDAIIDMEEANGEDGLDYGRRGVWDDVFGNEYQQFDPDTWPNSNTYRSANNDGEYYSGVGLSKIVLDEEASQVTFRYSPSFVDQGLYCESPLTATEENTMKAETLYYSYVMPAWGRLIISTDDPDVNRTDVAIGYDCESTFFTGSFPGDSSLRTPTIAKGQEVRIMITQKRAREDRPFTWKLSVKDPSVVESDSLAVIAVLNGLLDTGWQNEYAGAPVSDWKYVEVRNRRVKSLQINSSATRKDLKVAEDLYQLTALETLYISNESPNKLTTGISENIKNLTALKNISLNKIPTSGLIQNLPALKALATLDIVGGETKGQFPENMGTLTQLSILHISNANFQSALPKNLGTVSSLEVLDLSGNQVTGSIPSGLGKLKKLSYLNLSTNQISGGIPEDLISGAPLHTLDISHNQLTKVPDNLLSSELLAKISLSHNQISNFPVNVPKLSRIYTLDLAQNQIKGQIPTEISNRTFDTLDLSYNQLEGRMPALSVNAFLDVSHNRFTSLGKITPKSAGITEARVAANQFSFDDLLLNQALYPCWGCDKYKDKRPFWAVRQDSVHLQQEIVVQPGKTLSIDLS